MNPILITLSIAAALLKGPADPAQSLHGFSDSLKTLTEQVSRSVVQISASGYGLVNEDEKSSTGVLAGQRYTGSGIALSSDGYIITNAHVVSGARHIRVRVNGPQKSRSFEAKVVGLDTTLDIALLRIDATDLVPLPLADSDKLKQGQLVLAFGSPMGLDNSVSMGVISSVGRQISSDDAQIFIQTDAPINPGNSGGPLVDVDGRVVGVNTFIITQSGGSEGLGFAIPSNVVRYAYTQLKEHGHVHRGQMGIAGRTITEPLAEALGLAAYDGILVEDLKPDGSAANVGVHVGDVVKAIGERQIHDVRDLSLASFRYSIGDIAQVHVVRDGKPISFDVPVVEKEDDPQRVADLVDPVKNSIVEMGLLVIEVNAEVKKILGKPRQDGGILVAARTGTSRYVGDDLQPGDVIYSLNGHPLTSVDELRSVLNSLKPDSPIALQIERDSRLLYLVMEPD
jgi:serine protease Do